MNLTANLLLIVAALITVLLGITFAAPLPAAPDRAGIGIVCFLLQTPRWICLGIVLGMCVARGVFLWPANTTAQYVLVLGAHVLLGLGCIACGLVAMGGLNGAPVPDWIVRFLTLAPLMIPAIEILFAAWFLNPTLHSSLDPASKRLAVNSTLLVLLFTASAFGVAGAVAASSERNYTKRLQAEQTAKAQSEADAQQRTEEQAFLALGPETPFIEWLRFTEYPHSDEHRKAARDAILRRPGLAEDLTRAISSSNEDESMKTLYFVGELSKPPVAVAEAVREQARKVVRIAQSIDPAWPDSRDVLYAKAHSIAMGVQAAAFGLQRSGVDLTPELQAMADACRVREKESPRDIAEGCERIIRYLATPESHSEAPLLQK